jgi:fructose-specific component phosphotransferase system IIB-like protein
MQHCRVTLHVSGASAHHQEYLKTSTAATGTCVIVAGKSSHLIRAGTQLDAILCRFYFCRVALHVSGASAHHQEYLKTSTAATGTCVIVAGKSSHLLIRADRP